MKGWGRYRSLAPVLVLALLCLIIASINGNFLSFSNSIRLLSAAAVPLVLVIGATFVILMGSIDLSVEGVVALTAVAISMLVANDFTSLDFGVLSLPVALFVGGLIGFANGLIHVCLQIPSFMTTLGIGFACVGIATAILGGYTVQRSGVIGISSLDHCDHERRRHSADQISRGPAIRLPIQRIPGSPSCLSLSRSDFVQLRICGAPHIPGCLR